MTTIKCNSRCKHSINGVCDQDEIEIDDPYDYAGNQAIDLNCNKFKFG